MKRELNQGGKVFKAVMLRVIFMDAARLGGAP